MESPFASLGQPLLERFCRYVQIYTTSDHLSTTKPSTERQWTLLNLLAQELRDLGVSEVQVLEKGYVIGRIPPSPGREGAPAVAWLAHVDTASDAPGENVKPIVHRDYDGVDLVLPAGPVLSLKENPDLPSFKGRTLITSDGSTLLGADDKAGVAEIMTAVDWLLRHPEAQRGPLEIVFTSDEEVGRGTEDFPFDQLRAQAAYTLDGDREGTIQTECYYASMATLTFRGVAHHPGDARGRLVNALSMAASFVGLLPRSESPEATDHRWGCLWPQHLEGSVEEARLDVRVRDFDLSQLQRRENLLRKAAEAIDSVYPGGRTEVQIVRQYDNMKEELLRHPRVTALLEEAVRRSGLEPVDVPIRGGTDGSRLTEMGLPTPNIFTGGMNYHSRTEWVCLEVMVKAVEVLVQLADLWSREAP